MAHAYRFFRDGNAICLEGVLRQSAGWIASALAIGLVAAPAIASAAPRLDWPDRSSAPRKLQAVKNNPDTRPRQRQKVLPKEVSKQVSKQASKEVPKKTSKEAEAKPVAIPPGPLQVVVSIASQRVTVFSGGVPVAQSSISTGTATHPTPMGIFAIIGKNKWHRSNIYSGAPMPYMQRITWSGIALHQGVVPGYPASHGCIRLPEAFAIRLWGMTRLGARVIVTRDPVAPVAIAHPRLFVPQKPEEKIAAQPIRVAQAGEGVKAADAAQPAEITPIPTIPPAQSGPSAALVKRVGPVQVFVSRKDAKVYVRQDFTPLFDAPVTIAEPQKPWGTHVFTAMEIKGADVRWTAITIPSGYSRKIERDQKPATGEAARQNKLAADLANAPSADHVLEHFEISQEAVRRISELLAPGSALTVSDNPLSDETGLETDFVVLTR
jgi:lipoprotein-anchoring transpeptidase ErfK/SrfK